MSNDNKNFIGIGIVLLACICGFMATVGIAATWSQRFSKAPSVVYSKITTFNIPGTIIEVRESCSDGQCIDACIQHVKNQGLESDLDLQNYHDEEVTLIYYNVDENSIHDPRVPEVPENLLAFQQDKSTHEKIWNYFNVLIPREHQGNLVQFVVYTSQESSGKHEDTITGNWILKYNILSAEDVIETTETLVYLYGYHLMLSPEQQIPWGEICHQEYLHGCPTPESYANQFYLRFWKDIFAEWEEFDDNLQKREEDMGLFYTKYQDQFINEFAAEDPVKDMVESWTEFMLYPRHTGDSIVDQKVNFFGEFPELVELREKVITGICTYEQTP